MSDNCFFFCFPEDMRKLGMDEWARGIPKITADDRLRAKVKTFKKNKEEEEAEEQQEKRKRTHKKLFIYFIWKKFVPSVHASGSEFFVVAHFKKHFIRWHIVSFRFWYRWKCRHFFSFVDLAKGLSMVDIWNSIENSWKKGYLILKVIWNKKIATTTAESGHDSFAKWWSLWLTNPFVFVFLMLQNVHKRQRVLFKFMFRIIGPEREIGGDVKCNLCYQHYF